MFSKIDNSVVTDEFVFNNTIDLKVLFDLIGEPIFFAISTTVVKKELLKNCLDVSDRPQKNWRLAMLAITLGIFGYASHYIHYNVW